MKCPEISEANEKLQKLKEKFRYWQLNTEIIKQRIYDPYETEFDRHQWEMHNQYEILENRYILKNLEKEIKELRKTIKKMNREQNLKNKKL
jgi:hypothetical protein